MTLARAIDSSVGGRQIKVRHVYDVANRICVSLKGEEGVYRIRVGDFWILYEVFDQALVVLVVQVIRIGHRRE